MHLAVDEVRTRPLGAFEGYVPYWESYNPSVVVADAGRSWG